VSDISELGPVEWLRELFADASAESMFRWMLVAWLVLVVAAIVLDRISALLLGRSRPLTQEPPALARTWRWRRRQLPPSTYSMLPSGTLATPRPGATRPRSIPLSNRTPAVVEEAPRDPLMLERPAIPDQEYWEDMADLATPVFGSENNARLELGRPPERFNPVTGRVEELLRDTSSGTVRWSSDPTHRSLVIGAGTGPASTNGDTPDPDPRFEETAVMDPSDEDRAFVVNE